MYLSKGAIKWSIEQLRTLPKDQLALFFFLALAREGKVSRGTAGNPSPFEREILRYLGAPLEGGGVAAFNPFSLEWRAAEYMNSTVFGRLLNGSHKWTEGEDAFFTRTPAKGWPATLTLEEKGFDNLRGRLSPPCLKKSFRLPLTAVAVYYFRFFDLSFFSPGSMTDVVAEYRKEVLSLNERLEELFVPGPNYLRGDLFVNTALSEREKLECYPPSPFSGEVRKSVLIYADDLERIKQRLNEGQDIADFVRNLLDNLED